MNATEKNAVVAAAAVTEAARLCDTAIAASIRLRGQPFASPDLVARAKRYQKDEFSPKSAKVTRVVYDLFGYDGWASREEFLAAVDVYCAAGVCEVGRRFNAEQA